MRFALLLALVASCTETGARGLPRGQTATELAVGHNHVCAIVADRTLRCFGDNSAGQLGAGPATNDAGVAPRLVTALSNVEEVTAGGAHTCARLADRTVRCWGSNEFGQLGDATTIARAQPVVLQSVSNVRQLSAGGAHTCAIADDRTVWCWGRNDDGQLGDGSVTHRPVPVRATGLTDVEELRAGTFHTCARVRDGSVHCWGRNDAGQLGDGTSGTPRRIPTRVAGLGPVDAIAVGLADSCALLGDGTLQCWGRGVGRPMPSPVIGFPKLEQLAIAATPTQLQVCGRVADGTVRCTGALNETPRLIPGLVDASEIAAGPFGACAIRVDGSLRCWSGDPKSEPVAIVL